MSKRKVTSFKISPRLLGRSFYIDNCMHNECEFKYGQKDNFNAVYELHDGRFSVDLSKTCKHQISSWPFHGCAHMKLVLYPDRTSSGPVLCLDCNRICGLVFPPSSQRDEDPDSWLVVFQPTTKNKERKS